MLSSLRIYIITQSEGHRTNFNIYIRQADNISRELKERSHEIAFGHLETLAYILKH